MGTNFPIVVIGGSAGALAPLFDLVERLPAELQAAIFVVVHISPDSPGSYASLLDARGSLKAAQATNGEPIRPGRIYTAPPDFHLLLEEDRVLLSHGPRENRSRPAIDPLFRSAARTFGPRTTGILLSGALDDGTTGLLAIKARGGTALVQDPQEARYPGMVQSAIDHVKVDAVLPVGALAERLLDEVNRQRATIPAPSGVPDAQDAETDRELASTRMDRYTLDEQEPPGKPSGFACPDCGSALWELQEGALLRYRCRVGHAMTARTLLMAQSAALEDALWTALRALEEKIALAHTLAGRNRGAFRESMLEDAEDAKRHADVIRKMLKLEEFQVPE
jgi:two-component system chemotaxis response regulator CheB